MSDNLIFPAILQIKNIITQMHNIMIEMLRVMRQGFQAIASLEGVGRISKISSSTFGKQQGIKSQPDLLSYLQNIFSGDVFQPMAQTSGKGTDQSTQKALKGFSKQMTGVMKEVGKSIISAFDPILLLFQLITPMIQAFIEPLELLSTLFETWGTILSQLLIPVVISLFEALMPLTPAIIDLTSALMPILLVVADAIAILTPIISLVSSLISLLLNLLSIGTEFVGGFVSLFEIGLQKIIWSMNENFIIGLEFISGGLQIVGDFIRGFFDMLKGDYLYQIDLIKSNINNAKANIENFFTNILEKWNNTVGRIFGTITDEEEKWKQARLNDTSGQTGQGETQTPRYWEDQF